MRLLESKGFELARVTNLTDVPAEFLRDPSMWIEASQMEQFLLNAQRETGFENLAEEAAHMAIEFRPWGVLDGVLRMMEDPYFLFNQPERILSYFVSPAPPLDQFRKQENGVTFLAPISSSEYPMVTEYLRSAFESLPTFSGAQQAEASWVQNRITLTWFTGQNTLGGDENLGRQIRPELLQDLVFSLEKSQKQLEQKNQELIETNLKLQKAKEELERHLQEQIYKEKVSQSHGVSSIPAK